MMERNAKNSPSRIRMLDLQAQRKRLNGAIEKALSATLDHGRFISGPEVAEFEAWLAQKTSFQFAIGVSSGTDALLMMLMADHIAQGDAVFLPSFTYVATAEIVLLTGAHPVFVDVNPDNFQICPKDLVRKIEKVKKQGNLNPKAIIGVDLFGQPAPWSELCEVSEKYHVKLYDDCAQSFGAEYEGQASGKFARATTLSFFPAKPLGAYGDGGALLTDNPDLAQKYFSLRDHGKGKDAYEIIRVGLNARLDTMQAAILLAKTISFEEERQKRQEIAHFYQKFMPPVFSSPICLSQGRGAWSVYTVTLPDGMNRLKCREALLKENIESAIYYETPLHLQKAYRAYHDGESLPVSEALSQKVLSLPVHAYLSEEEVQKVISVMEDISLKMVS